MFIWVYLEESDNKQCNTGPDHFWQYTIHTMMLEVVMGVVDMEVDKEAKYQTK